ncbi:MAG: trypsin-like peptidase domain-containing protein [Patescibacteria group bacterium]
MKIKIVLFGLVFLVTPLFVSAATHSAGTNVFSNGTIYMVSTDGQLRPYTSAGAYLSYGFNSWSNAVQANSDDLALPIGSFIPPRDGKIVCSDRGADKGTCYLITNGTKAGFTSADVFNKLGFSFKYALSGDVSFLIGTDNISDSTQTHLPGTLINDNGTIKLVGTAGTVGVPSMDTLKSWGYSLVDVVKANSADKTIPQIDILASHAPGQLAWDSKSKVGNQPSGLHIDLVAPDKILAGYATNIVIKGSGFKIGAKVDFGSGGIEPAYGVVSDTQIAVIIPSGMPALTYNLTVTNPDGKVAMSKNALTVQAAPAVISTELSSAEIFAKVAPSTALIFTGNGNNLGAGTGIILSNDGYILTNQHVVASYTSVDVYLNDDGYFHQPYKHFIGTVLGTDSVNDLAIIKIPTTGLRPIEFGISGNLNLPVGSPVYALGFPLIFDVNASSVKMLSGKIVGTTGRYLQIDVPIQHGNSGGPLVNNQGQLVGINNLCLTTTQSLCTLQGQAFAIAIDYANPFIPGLKSGTPTTPIPTPTPTPSPTGTISLTKTSSYSNQTVVSPQTSYKIGSFNLAGNSTEAVNINTFEIDFAGTATEAAILTDVYFKYGSTVTVVKGTVSESDNTWSVNFQLGVNATMTVDVYATVASSLSTSTIRADLITTGVTVQSGTTVYADVDITDTTKNAGLQGQTITGVAAGSIIATTDVSTPVAAIVDDSGTVNSAAFKFSTVNDSYTITNVTLTLVDASTVSTVTLMDNGTAVTGGSKPGSTTITFSGLNIAVAANTTKVLTVQLTMAAVGVGAGTSGASVLTTLTAATARNSGGTSDSVIESDPSGNAMYVYHAIPTITNVILPTSVLVVGTQTVSKFNVSSGGTGTISWQKLIFTVAKNVSGTDTLASPTLWNSDTNTQISGTGLFIGDIDVDNDTAGGVEFVANSEQTISGSKTYELRMTIAGSPVAGDNITTQIVQPSSFVAPATYATVAGTTSAFVWTDQSAASHSGTTLDWNNGYLVKNLSTNSQVLSK